MQEQARALEVREELVAEADALARALDQSRHVGDDELAAVGRLDGAEHRRERRERIVGDLRPRVRDAREQRRLAGVRQPDERGVGEQLQPQLDLPLLPGETDLCEARRLPRGRGEVLVPAAAGAALRDDDARAGPREIGDEPLLRIDHLRADGNMQHRVVAARAVRQPPAAGPALARAQLLIRPHAGEIAPPRIRDEHDVAAVAAVAAVGSALRHVLLAPEVNRPVAPATGDDGQRALS